MLPLLLLLLLVLLLLVLVEAYMRSQEWELGEKVPSWLLPFEGCCW